MSDHWIPELGKGEGVKYLAIADALDAAIARGELAPGMRLPPQRDLASRLGVDLTTVTRAYETARLRGLIEARGRAGSFVCDPARIDSGPRAAFDAGMNMPPALPRGLLARTMARTASELLARDAACLQYQPAGGAREDRIAGATLLTRLGVPGDADHVWVTAGGQHALYAILRAGLSPGDAVACGTHIYSGLRAVAARLGVRLVPLRQLDAASVEAAATAERIRALYVVPTNDNPTTATLSATVRERIAAVCEQHDITVIEDDAYAALAAKPIAPIASLIPHRSWHVASMSKIISPALRVAFVHAPDIAAGLALAAALHETAVMAPPLNVAMVSSWIGDGQFDRLVAAMREESLARQSVAHDLLTGFEAASHPQGYHLWLTLPDGMRGSELAEAVRPTGLSVLPAQRFAVNDAPGEALRISLGGAVSHDELARGLRMLAGHLASPGAARAVV
jgi:DNA-binding transcriptional MocR family regulator